MKLEFEGPFRDSIAEHIRLKQSLGYKYEADAGHLLRFSRFTAEKYPNANSLTKEIVLAWCEKRPWEAQQNQCSRASILRQFAIYLNRHGHDAYIIPRGFYRKAPQYTPYIYTDEELAAFFSATDSCHPVSECPYRHLIMPLFFRMIYACGLRCSEARLLKYADVDLENGVLRVLQAKNSKDRLVPMDCELMQRCQIYASQVHSHPKEDDWFFPGMNGRPVTAANAYHNFRRFLRQAGISHGGRGHGPRIHDFRHTFCCRCLKKWSEEGKDLNAWLPVLKTYVGHESFYDTAYYLRMTADVYGDIEGKIIDAFPDVIPDREACHEEFQ